MRGRPAGDGAARRETVMANDEGRPAGRREGDVPMSKKCKDKDDKDKDKKDKKKSEKACKDEKKCCGEHGHKGEDACSCGCDDDDEALADEELERTWDLLDDVPAVDGFVRLCDDGWQQGWHERNGGNLTYRMTEEEAAAAAPYFDEEPRPWVEIGVTEPTLAGAHFVTTGSGKFMRNVATDVAGCIGIVEINEAGDAYRIVWGLANGARPTSEFPTHFMNHAVRMRVTDGAARVIYHAHTPAVIALSFVLPLEDRTFSRVLWKSMTECPVIFPEGVGVVPWMVPGGTEIAKATSAKMEDYAAVVWAQHGMFCSGSDFDQTFGLMHTIEKSAQIYRDARIMNGGSDVFRQTITDEGLRQVGEAFHVQLREEFLN